MTRATVVVGGGICGIVAALLAARRGDRVTLIERASHLGGLLASWRSPSGLSFDFGTHVLCDTGNQELDALLFDGLSDAEWHRFPAIRSGNVFHRRLTPHSPCIDLRALPAATYAAIVVEMLEAEGSPDEADLGRWAESRFGSTMVQAVFDPVFTKLVGRPAHGLHRLAARLFGVERFLATTPEATRRLKSVPAYDARFAFHRYDEFLSGHSYRYPRTGGIGRWIDRLRAALIDRGVEIRCGADLRRVVHGDRRVTAVELADARLPCDELLWTIPPVFLARAADIPLSGAPPRLRTHGLYHYHLDRPPVVDSLYVTCFDPALRWFRATLYDNLATEQSAAGHRLTVEVLSDGPQDGPRFAQELPAELRTAGVIAADTKILEAIPHWQGPSFPVLDPAFVDQSSAQAAAIGKALVNATVLGRAAGGSFFTNDVLLDTWKTVTASGSA